VNRLLAVLFLMLLPGGCGYHLAGGPPAALPQDVQSLIIIQVGDEAGEVSGEIRRELQLRAAHVRLVQPGDDARAELRIGPLTSTYRPVAYDAEGIATAFKAALSGGIGLWRDGVSIWSAGEISMQEDVFAVGGPASIEASKTRVLESLRSRWSEEAMQRFISGF